MMLRLAVRCPGCEQDVVVRIGMDTTERTQFYFPCPYQDCGLPIRGTVFSGDGSAFTVKFPDDIERDLASVPGDALVTTANPFVPGSFDAGSLDAFGGSSMFALDHLLGDRMIDFGAQRSKAAEVLRELWPPARRLYEYYLAENWEGFSRTTSKYFDDWNLPRDAKTHARAVAAHQPMLAVTWNIVEPSEAAAQFLETFCQVHLQAVKTPAYSELLKEDGDIGKVEALQRGVFDALERFVPRYEMWAMGALQRFMDQSRHAELDRLTLARDEFHETGPLYQHAFEAISKTLRYPVAAQNTLQRGDPNNFGDVHPQTVPIDERPRTMSQFERISNAHKIAYVNQIAEWQAFCSILDNKIRNNIGHSSTRHDLRSGRVVSDKDALGVSYTTFLAAVYEIFGALAVTSQLLRSVRVTSSRDWPPRS